ncbi:hypothetical protein Tco_0417046 [Tanacetum coccineum]
MCMIGNSKVKDNKIDLLVQQHEQFTILVEESIDSGFARFNTIITSLKALDEGFSSKNYVRKFLRALHLKCRAKVTTTEESKYLQSLALDDLIGKKEKVKSIALKAKKESSDDETSTSESDEEYAMVVRNLKSDRKCFRCDDLIHLIGDCPKPPCNKDQKAFIGGYWSDNEDEAKEKTNDETCLMAQSSDEVTLDSSHYSNNAYSLDDDILKLENAKLKEIQVKLVKFDKNANSLREMLNIQNSSSCKIGLCFDSSKASTSGRKPISFVGSSAETAPDGSTIKVHGSTISGSVDPSSSEKLQNTFLAHLCLRDQILSLLERN